MHHPARRFSFDHALSHPAAIRSTPARRGLNKRQLAAQLAMSQNLIQQHLVLIQDSVSRRHACEKARLNVCCKASRERASLALRARFKLL